MSESRQDVSRQFERLLEACCMAANNAGRAQSLALNSQELAKAGFSSLANDVPRHIALAALATARATEAQAELVAFWKEHRA
jgi:hypothetical protein